MTGVTGHCLTACGERRVLKGHDFSRAVSGIGSISALAAEGCSWGTSSETMHFSAACLAPEGWFSGRFGFHHVPSYTAHGLQHFGSRNHLADMPLRMVGNMDERAADAGRQLLAAHATEDVEVCAG